MLLLAAVLLVPLPLLLRWPSPGGRVSPAVCRRVAAPATGETARHRSFLLARHGQTTFNKEGRFQGSLDEAPVLTERGVTQARELGTWLGGINGTAPVAAVSAVFVSPLRRAQQTLEEASTFTCDLPEAIVLPELREIDLYEWEGLTKADVEVTDPEGLQLWKHRAWELRLGGGKPVVQDLWDRASRAWELMLEALPSDGDTGLVVAHGTLGKALLATAVGLPAEAFRHFMLGNGELVEVLWPAAGSEDKAGVRWRRRYPVEGPWRSRADELRALAHLEKPAAVEIA